jgi:hypothetical protein
LGAINTFFSTDLRIDNRFREGRTNRLYSVIDTAAYLQQFSDGTRYNLSNNSRFGFDWLINEQNSFTTSLNYNYRDSKSPESLNSNEYRSGYELSFDPSLLTYSDVSKIEDFSKDNSYIISSNYTKKFDTPKEILSIDFNYSNNVSFDNETRNTTSTTINAPFAFRADTENKSDNLIFNGNYSLPFAPKTKLEMGWNTNFRNTNSIYTPELFNFTDNNWASFDSLVNDFTYNENIYAAYGSYSDNFDAFDLQLGLRVESANINLYQAQTDKDYDISYNSLFPTLGMK